MSMKYSKEHEWVLIEGDSATVGITNYAQEQLGDVVFVEVPDAGKAVDKGDEVAVVESVKAASEIYAPISGEVSEGNATLEDAPATINSNAEGDGWIFKMSIGDASELDELMDAAAYADHVAGLE
ncbi:MAG: glycine cleavage system protein GcvH [Alphaproteobacteria bacterium]|jgi:glycine cleavage system H protein|nr:glycine cleavage system protein GcvH [Alphaproteobacteria bacterium]MBT4220011.1 glycine cleavage system protein GcvH [Rhodospirillaceae bacterium]MBT4464682.1 glycine cleavage system protein GcvH [Rhodospirillaceae bacterium]MBT5014000.1 glycine cleavage system protein GcvH [Rhodospirillaceae bacterium]MBT5309717.1 glycine cleavage system protein GcvH [Rhodospirillaceae bacterium]